MFFPHGSARDIKENIFDCTWVCEKKKQDTSINLPPIFFYLIRILPDELGDWVERLLEEIKRQAIERKPK
jgi:hypothetical protein